MIRKTINQIVDEAASKIEPKLIEAIRYYESNKMIAPLEAATKRLDRIRDAVKTAITEAKQIKTGN